MAIKIIGVDVERVGRPRNDGTRGSGLYKVPLKLSGRPSALWAETFREVWDRPPQWTTMHRPGIGYVSGDEIVLDGTTIEEVRDVHLRTLKVVLAEVERRVAEVESRRAAEREQQTDNEQEHDRHVREVADQIKFDG